MGYKICKSAKEYVNYHITYSKDSSSAIITDFNSGNLALSRDPGLQYLISGEISDKIS